MKEYNWTITVNLPDDEIELEWKALTANAVMARLETEYPNAESVVLVTTFPG